MSMKEIMKEANKEFFLPGNSACPGCGLEIALRWALKALGQKTIIVAPASCTNVIIGFYPKSAPAVPHVNMAFAAGCAAASGIRTALKARGIDDTTVMCWSGDGGAYDIGLQASSGAAERGVAYEGNGTEQARKSARAYGRSGACSSKRAGSHRSTCLRRMPYRPACR